MFNLRANDEYELNVFSESDEEFPGKRVRLYSFDPDKDFDNKSEKIMPI